MKISKQLEVASFLLLGLQSTAAFAEYYANISQTEGFGYFTRYSANEVTTEAASYSATNSALNYDFFVQPSTVAEIDTSLVNATIKNSGVPYVSAQTFARGYTGNNSVSNRTDTNIRAVLGYDLLINAAPNTLIPITMTSYYEMAFKTVPVTYIPDSNFVIGYSASSANVGLAANFNSSVGSKSVIFEASCGTTNGICNSRIRPSTIAESLEVIHLGTVEFEEPAANASIIYTDQTYDLTADLASVVKSDNDYFIKQSFVTNFLLDVGENGLVNGLVEINVRADSTAVSQFNIAESYAYIDPYFTISPLYLALFPDAKITITDGVGNDNPLGITNPSAVPLPAAAWLFASAIFGFFGLRKRV